jgi:hypothetical protein
METVAAYITTMLILVVWQIVRFKFVVTKYDLKDQSAIKNFFYCKRDDYRLTGPPLNFPTLMIVLINGFILGLILYSLIYELLT